MKRSNLARYKITPNRTALDDQIKHSGHTLRSLAKVAGYNSATLSQLFQGKQHIKLEDVAILANILKISRQKLLLLLWPDFNTEK